jgi:endonuclease/exonuclease/phosphatase family metal-dependent hydrolase
MSAAVEKIIKIAQFNLENFFVYMDHPLKTSVAQISESEWQGQSISLFDNKSLLQLKEIARCILDINADIYFLCEVGGLESLKNFNEHFLNDSFHAFSHEGNSERGIDLAYLVKRNPDLRYELITHKERSLDFLYPHERQSVFTEILDSKKSHKFSRDVSELRVFSTTSQKPNLICLNVHLKSQLDKENIDPLGKDRRRAELEKLLEIYLEVSKEFNHEVPMVIGGDFNGIASKQNTDAEFLSIYTKTPLLDVFDVAGLAQEKRITHIQIPPYGKAWMKQFDYLFISPQLQSKMIKDECYVYRYKDQFGKPHALPTTLIEKRKLASDHYPVVASFKLNTV